MIEKSPQPCIASANLPDYATACKTFTWQAVRQELTGSSHPGNLNITQLAVDRHAEGKEGDPPAMSWIDRNGGIQDISFKELKENSCRFANVLKRLGVHREDRVFTLTGRVPEQFYVAFGTWRNASVFCPLYANFGPEPIFQRLERGDARVLVTTERLFRQKVAKIRGRLPRLQFVLLTDTPKNMGAGVWSLPTLMAKASDRFAVVPTKAEDIAVIHFTSGTTGMPKGAVHVHEAVIAHYATARYVLDLRPGDIFWCTADPGWVTGVSYGMIAPLVIGATVIIDENEFDVERWCRMLAEQKITVWYTSPTVIRRFMRVDSNVFKNYDFSNLRRVFSVGEPLAADAVLWGQQTLGIPIHDTWWQTETGSIMIANIPGADIRPGSMGRPIPGIETAIVRKKSNRTIAVVDEPDEPGHLTLRRGWPSMFRDYLHEQERYRKCFAGDWYLTGDLVRRDADGYFWFIGRYDDVIITSGHLVGPFEVESVLTAHPAVDEAGVIGRPDPVAGEIVKAYVTLRTPVDDEEAFKRELIGFARKRLGPALAPREIAVVTSLPKNRAGKILRRVLKLRETVCDA